MSENEGGGLQFDRADFGAKTSAPLQCGLCGTPIESVYYQVGPRLACAKCATAARLDEGQGSGPARFLKAALFGSAAGALGAGIWYAVSVITQAQLGLIAIVVGLMVGTAVRRGSGGRGGAVYQALAMFLTYASIVSTYIPLISKDPFASATRAAYVIGLAFAVPFLAGFKNILGIVIIGIGLYEAWKVNRGAALVIRGPYRAGQAPSAVG